MAVLPESLADFYREGLHAIEITRPVLRGRLELAWRTERPTSPAARALIGRACDMLEDPPADRWLGREWFSNIFVKRG